MTNEELLEQQCNKRMFDLLQSPNDKVHVSDALAAMDKARMDEREKVEVGFVEWAIKEGYEWSTTEMYKTGKIVWYKVGEEPRPTTPELYRQYLNSKN